jgi:hypothetical protein
MAAIHSARAQGGRPQAFIGEAMRAYNINIVELTPQPIHFCNGRHLEIEDDNVGAILLDRAPHFFQIVGQRDSFEVALQVFGQ